MYDFSTSAPRENTNAEKYTLREKLFGTQDVLPVWVADMDIQTPDFVLDAVKKRLEHPILGYEEIPNDAYEAQIKWMKEHHALDVNIDDFFYSHSVVASMSAVIEAFTNEGDGVIVQTPVYPPFFHSVLHANRRLIKHSLIQGEDGSYSFDIKELEAHIDENTKLFILCSPHNPVGRVWSREELEQILDLCVRNNIVVFADEIHSDLVYDGFTHIPFSSLSQEAKDITITAVGPGKTFNMAGFAISSLIIQNEELRKQFKEVYHRIHFAQGSVLSHVAFKAAYKQGDTWLKDLKVHLQNNYKMLRDVCNKYPELIKVTPIEATYLAWLDCRGLGLKDKELRDFFVQQAKLGLNAGISFGREGSGFMRLNFAIPQDMMLEVIKRLDYALKLKYTNK